MKLIPLALGIIAVVLLGAMAFGSPAIFIYKAGAFLSWTDWSTPVQHQIEAAEMDSQMVLHDEIVARRSDQRAESIAHDRNPGAAFYNAYSDSAQSAHSVHVGTLKTIAELKGTRLPSGPIQNIPANASDWVPLGLQVFPGDKICVDSELWNELWTMPDPKGRRVPVKVDADGTNKESIDGHTKFYPDAPMLSIMGRLNGTKIVRLHAGCNYYRDLTGSLEVMANQPYWNENGLASPGFANYTHGNISVRREGNLEEQLQKKQEDDNSNQEILRANLPDRSGRARGFTLR